MLTVRPILLLLLGLIPFYSCHQEPVSDHEFSVMVWNIWRGGKSEFIGRDGIDDVIGIIEASEADVVLMIETYGSGKRIADSLGYFFHLIAAPMTSEDDPSTNLSVLSRFPIGERVDFYNYFNIGGVEISLTDKDKLLFFDMWLNYQPWHDQPHLMEKTPEELIAWEKSGTREKEVKTILEHLQAYLENSDEIPVILGGDFNVWSHLDWTEETKSIHNGKVVPWWTTSAFEEAGLKDSFRESNPDPRFSPGVTWGMPDKEDDHRVDYLLYKGGRLEVMASETHKVDFNHQFNYRGKAFSFPSDHGFVWTKFKLLNK